MKSFREPDHCFSCIIYRNKTPEATIEQGFQGLDRPLGGVRGVLAFISHPPPEAAQKKQDLSSYLFSHKRHLNFIIYKHLLIYSFKTFEANPWPFEVVQCYAFPMSGTM